MDIRPYAHASPIRLQAHHPRPAFCYHHPAMTAATKSLRSLDQDELARLLGELSLIHI